MEERALGRTGRSVGVIGLGTWQLGGEWGSVSEPEAFEVLDAAVDAGITFIDTADRGWPQSSSSSTASA